jgi:hypothetical protein
MDNNVENFLNKMMEMATRTLKVGIGKGIYSYMKHLPCIRRGETNY